MTEASASSGAAFGTALLNERLRLHDRALPANVGFTLLSGAVLVLLLWARLPPVTLLTWYGVLLGALGVRLAVS
ncbi:MAG TPA: hypothetical protein PLA97_03520, partial [Rubrivivax sp.]|nr:hypothetical protein [Rubrivivax sp.]